MIHLHPDITLAELVQALKAVGYELKADHRAGAVVVRTSDKASIKHEYPKELPGIDR